MDGVIKKTQNYTYSLNFEISNYIIGTKENFGQPFKGYIDHYIITKGDAKYSGSSFSIDDVDTVDQFAGTDISHVYVGKFKINQGATDPTIELSGNIVDLLDNSNNATHPIGVLKMDLSPTASISFEDSTYDPSEPTFAQSINILVDVSNNGSGLSNLTTTDISNSLTLSDNCDISGSITEISGSQINPAGIDISNNKTFRVKIVPDSTETTVPVSVQLKVGNNGDISNNRGLQLDSALDASLNWTFFRGLQDVSSIDISGIDIDSQNNVIDASFVIIDVNSSQRDISGFYYEISVDGGGKIKDLSGTELDAFVGDQLVIGLSFPMSEGVNKLKIKSFLPVSGSPPLESGFKFSSKFFDVVDISNNLSLKDS